MIHLFVFYTALASLTGASSLAKHRSKTEKSPLSPIVYRLSGDAGALEVDLLDGPSDSIFKVDLSAERTSSR